LYYTAQIHAKFEYPLILFFPFYFFSFPSFFFIFNKLYMSEHQEDNNNAVVSEQQQQQQQNEEDQLTLRALVSTREAGVIIGKGGKNVAELRDATGVKAGVSKVVQGVHDRVLTVSGTLEGVAMVRM
jgi:predicted RNA-binding protein YlqC (UPF0109 family)